MGNKAYSLNMGINHVDKVFYNGKWSGRLQSCEADAEAMHAIAVGLNYERTELLLTEQVTRAAFFRIMAVFQKKLVAGDLALITFSGHGAQVPDVDGDEWDGLDETWCFYDGLLLDDDIKKQLQLFAPGVRVLVVSDSCFSGAAIARPGRIAMWGGIFRMKLPEVKASILLIASSQEFEPSDGDHHHGHFTAALLKVWDNGRFSGNFEAFYQKILEEVPFTFCQTPNQVLVEGADEWFEEGRPFVI